MNNLKTGEFYGVTNAKADLSGLTLTDTVYTHKHVDWHYHENAYFTFILAGKVLEGNKKQVYPCTPGTLLFHHWQEAHYNIKPDGFTRGFHVELDKRWLTKYGIDTGKVQGGINLAHPQFRTLIYNIFKEFKIDAEESKLAVDGSLVDLLSRMTSQNVNHHNEIPAWVPKLKDILHDSATHNWTLQALSHAVGIHPVHLSRDFSRYFNCNLGDYIRTIKINRAIALFSKQEYTLTNIALECGFADQSHFIRTFKSLHQLTPLYYRRLLQNK
jgi:AraC family transcriptional regulator